MDSVRDYEYVTRRIGLHYSLVSVRSGGSEDDEKDTGKVDKEEREQGKTEKIKERAKERQGGLVTGKTEARERQGKGKAKGDAEQSKADLRYFCICYFP